MSYSCNKCFVCGCKQEYYSYFKDKKICDAICRSKVEDMSETEILLKEKDWRIHDLERMLEESHKEKSVIISNYEKALMYTTKGYVELFKMFNEENKENKEISS